MTVHRDKFLMNKTSRRNKFQIYWYYDSTCFGQPFRPSLGVLSRTVLVLMTVCYQEQDSILLLVANGHQNCIKRTNADVRLRTPDDGGQGCPKLVES